MSTKRQPSKQRRQTQNQRQRAALETRRANAAAGGVAGSVADGKAGASERSSTTSSGGGGSVFSRLRGASTTGRAIRTGGAGRTEPPGYRAAMSGLLAAVAAAVAGALFIPVAVDASGDQIASRGALVGEWTLSAYDVVQENPEATSPDEVTDLVEDWMPSGTEPYGKAAFPLSLGLVLPVVGAGLAFRAVSKRSPAKVVNRTLYITLFGTLLNAQLIFIFLPAVIGIGVAAFQVRKAELRAAAEVAEAAGDGPDGEDDDVIDVDEVIDAEEAVEGDQLIEADAAEERDEEAAARSVISRLRRRP